LLNSIEFQKTDATVELVEELQIKTKEFLQPNPTARAKMAAVKGISKLSGQAKAATYPQPEGVLGECMVTYGKKLGDDSLFGESLEKLTGARFEVFMAMKIQVMVFWAVMPHSDMVGYQHFRGSCCLYLHC
jgi:hypothetical protein